MRMTKMRKKFGEDGYASAVCGNEGKVGRRVWKRGIGMRYEGEGMVERYDWICGK